MAEREDPLIDISDRQPTQYEEPQRRKCGCGLLERFKKMTLGKQICISVFFFLLIVFAILFVVIIVNLRILMDNTYSKLTEKIDNIYLDNLENLNREIAATLAVHQDISEKTLNKTKRLVEDILQSNKEPVVVDGELAYHVRDYPILWTEVPPLTKAEDIQNSEEKFGDLDITRERMTYITYEGGFNEDVLRKLNTLNSIWTRINSIMIGQDSNINITRSFIMVEKESDTLNNQKMLATFPGQKFDPVISSDDFSGFSWYKEALKDHSSLVKINRGDDPFNGGLKNTSGFVKAFNSNGFQGVVGVMYTSEDINNLLSIFFKDQSESEEDNNSSDITTYISNPSEEFLVNRGIDVFDLPDTIRRIRENKDLQIYQDTVYNTEVIVKEQGYYIKDLFGPDEPFHKRQSLSPRILQEVEGDFEAADAAIEPTRYSMVAFLIPALQSTMRLENWIKDNQIYLNFSSKWTESTNIDDYDYLVILLEDQRGVQTFSNDLKIRIENEFWILMFVVVGCSLLLCVLIGLCVLCATKRITSPIQKLTDLTSNIKKVHKIEEIREKVKDHELFKKFKKKNAMNSKNSENQDEIQELISIFYNFFIQDNDEKEENNMLKMSQYEYPTNLYHEATGDISSRSGESFEEEKSSSGVIHRNVRSNNSADPDSHQVSINRNGESDEDDTDDLLHSSDDDDEGDHSQAKMKPPIAINWEHIIKEHIQ